MVRHEPKLFSILAHRHQDNLLILLQVVWNAAKVVRVCFNRRKRVADSFSRPCNTCP
jgi:hypothetical protein